MDRIDELLNTLIQAQDNYHVCRGVFDDDMLTGDERRAIYDKLEADRDAARQQIVDEYRDLLAALESVEWVRDEDLPEYDKWCPWCGNYRKYGHASDCQRHAALARARGES